jgi:LacI family transcriptional regulator
MGRPSLRDVAALAGTSTAVVSYVVNGGPRPVAAHTRERVDAAIAELGYRPNKVAQSLRRQSTGTLGLVVPDLTKSFFAELAATLEDVAFSQGRRLLISSSQFSPVRELEHLQGLLDAQVDGVALTPTGDPTGPVQLLRRSGVPWVLLHRHPDTLDVPAHAVVGDDRQAGRIATQHLLEHGHTRIACLTGPGPGSPVHQRTQGFRDATQAALGRVDEDLVLSCGYQNLSEAAYRTTADLLQRRPDVTAVCATTDEHALGVYRAAAQTQRRIGRSLAVISIDGTNHTQYLTPALTVVAAPFHALATHAVASLVQPQDETTGNVTPLPLQLITRSSCGC